MTEREDEIRERRCGHTVLDEDGIEEPCDRPATGWRWYQDVEHEDALDVACEWHANEGGRRLHEAEAEAATLREVVQRVRGLRDVWNSSAQRLDEWVGEWGKGYAKCRHNDAKNLTAALGDAPEGDGGVR